MPTPKKTAAAKPAGTDAPAPSLIERKNLKTALDALARDARHVADPRDAVAALAGLLSSHLGD